MTEPVPQRLRTAIVGLFVAVTAASLLGTALAPYLLVQSPLLLVALSASAPHVALAAASVDPVTLVVVATLRRALTGLAAYGLGYAFGHTAIEWLERRHPRLARLVRLAEQLYARLGVWLLIIAPAPTIALLAGAARSRFVYFLAALTLGHILWNALTQYLGDMFSRSTELLTAFLSKHLLESTLICVAVVVLQQVVTRMVRRRRLPTP